MLGRQALEMQRHSAASDTSFCGHSYPRAVFRAGSIRAELVVSIHTCAGVADLLQDRKQGLGGMGTWTLSS